MVIQRYVKNIRRLVSFSLCFAYTFPSNLCFIMHEARASPGRLGLGFGEVTCDHLIVLLPKIRTETFALARKKKIYLRKKMTRLKMNDKKR